MATYDIFGAQTRKPGFDGVITLFDASGNKYELVADDTSDSLLIRKNGAAKQYIGPPVVSAKTADYTVVAADDGKLFTTKGAAGAVNFTLPAPTAVPGFHAIFYQAHDEEMKVTSGTADTMVVFNDLAADSIAFTTAAEHIGNTIEVWSDGALWLTRVSIAAEAVTSTIVTA